MDPKLLLIEAAYQAVKWLVDKARHHDTKADEAALREVARQMAEAAVQRADLELRRMGIELASDALAAAALEMLTGIAKAEHGTSIPKLDLDIEEVPPGTPLTPLSDVTADDIPTKPGV